MPSINLVRRIGKVVEERELMAEYLISQMNRGVLSYLACDLLLPILAILSRSNQGEIRGPRRTHTVLSYTMGSRQHLREMTSGPPLPYQDDIRAYKREYAEALDAQDPLHKFREEFIIPSKKDLKRTTLAVEGGR